MGSPSRKKQRAKKRNYKLSAFIYAKRKTIATIYHTKWDAKGAGERI
jgi:hypothetical protein